MCYIVSSVPLKNYGIMYIHRDIMQVQVKYEYSYIYIVKLSGIKNVKRGTEHSIKCLLVSNSHDQ